MTNDLNLIRARIAAAAKLAGPHVDVAEIDVEADSDGGGTDFLRIVLHIGEEARDEDLEAVLLAIEHAVGEIDPRYPSVRFADAA